jgi:hypothetical protein
MIAAGISGGAGNGGGADWEADARLNRVGNGWTGVAVVGGSGGEGCRRQGIDATANRDVCRAGDGGLLGVGSLMASGLLGGSFC